MPRLRLALAQIDPAAGDLAGNAALALSWTARAAAEGAQVVAFPELALTGYPTGGLNPRAPFVAASRRASGELARRLAAAGLGERVVMTGHLDGDERGAFSALAVLHRGERLPASAGAILRIGEVDVALANGEFDGAALAGVGLVLHSDARPYRLDARDTRLALLASRAAAAGAVVASVNLVGGQDELVFDGDSMAVRPDGALIARAPQFAERLVVLDLDLPAASGAPDAPEGLLSLEGRAPAQRRVPAVEIAGRVGDEAAVWQALVLGLRDYVRKNGLRSVTLGLSGGLDSSVVAAIACDAVGPANVVGVSMPGEPSSARALIDARGLALRTGLDYRVEPIQPMVDGFLANLALSGTALENLRSRVRGVVLMALADHEQHLVLATADRTALAVGCAAPDGGFAPLKDVPRTLVHRLARWRNEEAERRGDAPPISRHAVDEPPAPPPVRDGPDAGAPPQCATLDAILAGHLDAGLSRDELLAAGHDEALVDRTLRAVGLARYKRRQSVPGTKIIGERFRDSLLSVL